jgi:hypothetical protein
MENSHRTDIARVIRSYQPDEARQMKALRALMNARPARPVDQDLVAPNAVDHDDRSDTAQLLCGPAATQGPGQPIPSPRKAIT